MPPPPSDYRLCMDRTRASLAALAPADGTYSWQVDDPWIRLTSEVLLSRTRRTVVTRVFPKFIENWPTPTELASASAERVWDIIRPTGFRRRVDQLIAIGAAVDARSEVPRRREDLLELPGVGEYVADAVRLVAFDGDRMPLDMNVDRVVSRIAGTAATRIGRSPYDNDVLVDASHELMRGSLTQRRTVFTGTLELSAMTCRPNPICGACPLSSICDFSLAAHRGEIHSSDGDGE